MRLIKKQVAQLMAASVRKVFERAIISKFRFNKIAHNAKYI